MTRANAQIDIGKYATVLYPLTNYSSFCWKERVFHVLAAQNLGREQKLMLSPHFSGGQSIQVKN